MAVAKKAPNPIDKHVGSRVRMRRMMLAMSQEKLGDALGLTFQQVQKYEKGTNRIGASRLQQIASIQQVPISFFFEGVPGSSSSVLEEVPSSAYVPPSMPRRTGSRSRRPTCASETLSSGDPLLTWLSRSPEMTNTDKGRGADHLIGLSCRPYSRHRIGVPD